MKKLLSKFAILLAAAAAAAFADTINFDNLCPSQTSSGACAGLFSTVGNAENLDIATSIGTVVVQGGALFDDISNLPADETAVYGTAGNASGIGVTPNGTGFTNPITITFPEALTSFSLDVLNGNTVSVEYQLADNAGNVQDLTVAPNFSSGLQVINLGATGTVVTLTAETGQSTSSGMTWDFLIDNISFTSASGTPTTATPEPVPALLIGMGLITLGLVRRHAKCVIALLSAIPFIPCSSATTTSEPITLACSWRAAGVENSQAKLAGRAIQILPGWTRP
jgi:hypothetical protein